MENGRGEGWCDPWKWEDKQEEKGWGVLFISREKKAGKRREEDFEGENKGWKSSFFTLSLPFPSPPPHSSLLHLHFNQQFASNFTFVFHSHASLQSLLTTFSFSNNNPPLYYYYHTTRLVYACHTFATSYLIIIHKISSSNVI